MYMWMGYFGGIIWEKKVASDLYEDFSIEAYQFGELVWHELSFMAVTCVFAWWWLSLKRENVKGAFALAIGGFAIARGILSLYRSLETAGFNLTSIDPNEQFIFIITAVFVLLIVLIIELKRGMIATNFIVFLLALLLVVPQILKRELYTKLTKSLDFWLGYL